MRVRVVFTIALALILSCTLTYVCYADNPLVQTVYTADPAPMVYNDTLYLYTSHDEDGSSYFTMNDWRVYSTTDMVNWTDHGAPLSYKTFSWARGDAWAGQCIERNGRFYWYICVTHRTMGRPAIGVAVADSPTGPFIDPIGYPLVSSEWGDIDPTVFIDDDGQAYLYWGNPKLKYVKLNEDMISYDEEVGIVSVPMKEEYFGKREGNPDRATLYEEGPWLYKRKGIYYMVYAASGIPENIAYATGDSPTGPWTYRGIIMPTQGGSFTNHPGIIDFKGKSYFFYHNGALPGGGGFTRSVAIEEFEYYEDGSFPTINMTKEGVSAIAALNPYARVEAETISWAEGVETRSNAEGGIELYDIDDGDYIKIKNVDFGTGASAFTARAACAGKGGQIELRLDSKNGDVIGTLNIGYSGGDDRYDFYSTNVNEASEVHDLFLVFKGDTGDLFSIDYWQFQKRTAEHKPVALNASTDQYKIDTVAGSNTAKLSAVVIYADGKTEDVSLLVLAEPVAKDYIQINDGVITAVNYGVAEIKVSYGEVSDIVHVYVKDFTTEKIVDKLIVNNNAGRLTLGENGNFSIMAVYKDGHIENVTTRASYSNPNKEIAAVANGAVMSKAVGSTEVMVSFKGDLGDELTTRLVITVVDKEAEESESPEPVIVSVNGVTISSKDIRLEAGEKKTLLYKVLPVNANNKKVSWSSDKPEVATVDKYGKVTAVNKGTAIITITTEEGSFTDQCELIVMTEGQPAVEQPAMVEQDSNTAEETLAMPTNEPVEMEANNAGLLWLITAIVLAALAAGVIIYIKIRTNRKE